MRRSRFGFILSTAIIISFIVIRCAGPNSGGGTQNLSGSGGYWNAVRRAADVKPIGNGYCRVTDAVQYVSTSEGNRVAWIRGGGWEDNQTLERFGQYVPTNGYAALVLSATDGKNSQQFYNFYAERMKGVRLKTVYTSDGHDANLAANAATIQKSSAIIITGGNTNRLRHLPGTAVGNAIATAYRNGVPVYTNSASVALVGTFFGWDLTTRQRQSGLVLLQPTFVSHLEDPQKFKQGLDDLWSVVPNPLPQSFGLTAGTLAVVTGTTLQVYGAQTSENFVYVYDARLPRTEKCRYWILYPGEKFGIGM